MNQRTTNRLWLAASAFGVLSATANAQIFIDNQSDIPSGNPDNNSLSENIDFGDVDLDGDWDAVFADGGDAGNDQNRIWINRGGAQNGPIGVFQDQTASRFPSIQDDSRDIEFADIDNDRDLDIYISNTAQITNQGNHWWVNNGFLQGGSIGFYTDETAARWINLGGSGSSIAPAALISGTFIDWSCDCDFGDLDNDGDLDLVHSSYGGAFSGNVPTRIFLNDGTGRFEEFNPSGFQLSGDNINNGNPALWCEGTQQSNTTNSNGTFADIASSALDIDVGDIDGDFDLDILHGARQELPRMFENRLEENGGTLGFRDVTTAVFPANWSTGDGHYEQEMGDMDGDGDLDIYGLNWEAGGFAFDDVTFRNNGSGVFTKIQTLSSSGDDDNEGDFIDYDNDGDLDLFVANFSGRSRLYQNNGSGSLSFVSSSTSGMGAVSNFVALDADVADVDKDGDYDVFQSNDNGSRNQYFENTTNVPDTHAPYIPRRETIGNQTASAGRIPIRAHVYDNAPYYITWYNDTDIEISVDGIDLGDFTAMSSAGQVFRAEVPRTLVGNVQVNWKSADEYGNTGTSAPFSYTGSYGGTFYTLYGPSSPDVNGNAPAQRLLSIPVPGDTFYIAVEGQANQGCRVALAAAPLVPPVNIPPIGGFLNIDVVTAQVLATVNLGPTGKRAVPAFLPDNFLPGQKIWFQIQAVAQTPSGPSFSLSQGMEITVQ